MTIPEAAQLMLTDLLNNSLTVVLIPSRKYDYGYIRVADTQNAEWYRHFCSQYKSTRKTRSKKFKTLIKRQSTILALRQIASGNITMTPYIDRLLTECVLFTKNGGPQL